MYFGEKGKNTKTKENSTKMTRKQALLAVLATATDKEAIAVIQKMIENMPSLEWDLATIDDAIEQFKFDHGYYPMPSNFRDDKKLPSAATVIYRAGVPLKDYLKRFYKKMNNSVWYSNKPKEEWLKIFQLEFDRIHPKGANDYNTRRDKSTPSWNIIANMFGTKKWNELLVIAERNILRVRKQKARTREKLTVKSYSDVDWI